MIVDCRLKGRGGEVTGYGLRVEGPKFKVESSKSLVTWLAVIEVFFQ